MDLNLVTMNLLIIQNKIMLLHICHISKIYSSITFQLGKSIITQTGPTQCLAFTVEKILNRNNTIFVRFFKSIHRSFNYLNN